MERHKSCILNLDRAVGTPWNMSFAGCGFLGIYHVGVASCIRQYAPHLASGTISGASAGALAATGLICDCDLGEATTQVLQIALKIRNMSLGILSPTFNLSKFVAELLDDFLPYDAHVTANGRLRVSVSKFSMLGKPKNIILDHFDSREDLINALVCSSFIPFFCGCLPPKFNGTYYFDGGLSDNIPEFNQNTITVSPFAGEADVCPADTVGGVNFTQIANTNIQLTQANLYRFQSIVCPPSPEELSGFCHRGFDDCLKFLQKNSHISCTRHLSVQSVIGSATAFEKKKVRFQDEDEVDSQGDIDEHLQAVSIIDLTSQEDMEYCGACRHKVRLSLLDSLPEPVSDALNACKHVNQHLFFRLHNMGFEELAQLVISKLLFPVDIGQQVIEGIKEWIYYLPDWMQDAVRHVLDVVYDVYTFVNVSRHRFSARFECQMALTELEDYEGEFCYKCWPISTVPPGQRKLNIDFTTDAAEKNRHLSAEQYVSDIRQQMLLDESSPEEVFDAGVCDTMQNCLHVCEQMDALLAYHYTTADQQVCLAEIYPLKQTEVAKTMHQFVDNDSGSASIHMGHISSNPSSASVSRSSSISLHTSGSNPRQSPGHGENPGSAGGSRSSSISLHPSTSNNRPSSDGDNLQQRLELLRQC